MGQPQDDTPASSFNKYTLFCMVEGQSTSRAFSVKVSPSDTTDDLKKLIAAEKIPGLGSRSRELDLYIVTIPDDHFNEKEPIYLKSIQFKRFLRITDTISDVFEDTLPRNTIHIMVEEPRTGNLGDQPRCYFVDPVNCGWGYSLKSSQTTLLSKNRLLRSTTHWSIFRLRLRILRPMIMVMQNPTDHGK